MELKDLPQFTVEEIHPTDKDGEVCVVGRFSHLRGVRDARGFLYRSKGPSIAGDLDKVPASTSAPVRFTTTESEYAPELKPGAAYPWLDGNWEPAHVAMVLAPQTRWEKRSFSTDPARYFELDGVMGWQPVNLPLPNGAIDLGVRAGGWDHLRCELCPEELGAETVTEGYVDPDGRWLCAHCFGKYAKSHDISFAIGD